MLPRLPHQQQHSDSAPRSPSCVAHQPTSLLAVLFGRACPRVLYACGPDKGAQRQLHAPPPPRCARACARVCLPTHFVCARCCLCAGVPPCMWPRMPQQQQHSSEASPSQQSSHSHWRHDCSQQQQQGEAGGAVVVMVGAIQVALWAVAGRSRSHPQVGVGGVGAEAAGEGEGAEVVGGAEAGEGAGTRCAETRSAAA